MEGRFFIARFYCREDYLPVLEVGLWIMLDHYLTVSKWWPNLRPSTTIITSTMVWIQLPELPIELFDEGLQLRSVSQIGKAIRPNHHGS